MFSYTAYGLSIESEMEIPALPPVPAHDRADISIRFGDLRAVREALETAGLHQRLSREEVSIRSPDLGTLVMRGGREILLDPPPELNRSILQLIVLGLPLAALLQQRGFLLLHGSAVKIGGGAVAFVGPSGIGKSTLAASLHARGYELVVDDVVAIRFDSGTAQVQPGFPQFKLWPDSARALGHDPDKLPLIHPEQEKRAHRVAHGFSASRAVPLRRIYFLTWGDTPRVEQIGQRDAFLKLSGNSYGVRWLHQVSGPAFFEGRAQLVRDALVRNLVRPRDLEALDSVVELVEKDCLNGN